MDRALAITATWILGDTSLALSDISSGTHDVINPSRPSPHFLYCKQQKLGVYSLVWPDPIPHQGKGSGIWPQSNLSPRTEECVPITAQYSVTWYLKYVINGKIQNFSLNRARTWSMRSVHWAISVLRRQLEHSRIEIADAERLQVLLCHRLHDCHVTSWLDLHD